MRIPNSFPFPRASISPLNFPARRMSSFPPPSSANININARAVLLRTHGPPSSLSYEPITIDTSNIQRPQLLIRQTAIGVNFHDTYVRSGLYKTLALPGVPGIEAVGVVEQVLGNDDASNNTTSNNEWKVGDRIGYVTGRYGAYASHRLLDADLAFKLPSILDDLTAASVLVRGLTTEILVTSAYRVKRGTVALVHAAAGGVGRLLSQRLTSLGAIVIGTAGSLEKANLAKQSGCNHVILYRQEDFVSKVKELTNGRGVDVAYDSVGRDTFMGSLACLAVRGHLVYFGQSSGSVPPLDPSVLAKGSNTLIRPILFHYISDKSEREKLVRDLFGALEKGEMKVPEPAAVLKLEEACKAHELLEGRTVNAPIVLVP